MHAGSPPLWDRIESLKPNGRVPWRPSAPTAQVALCDGGPSPALAVADQFDPVITAVRSAWPIARSAVSPLASSGYGEHCSLIRTREGVYPPTCRSVTRTSPPKFTLHGSRCGKLLSFGCVRQCSTSQRLTADAEHLYLREAACCFRVANL